MSREDPCWCEHDRELHDLRCFCGCDKYEPRQRSAPAPQAAPQLPGNAIDADLAAAKLVLFAGGPSVRQWIELGTGDLPDRIALVIANARRTGRTAGAREDNEKLTHVSGELRWQASLCPAGSGIAEYWANLANMVDAIARRNGGSNG